MKTLHSLFLVLIIFISGLSKAQNRKISDVTTVELRNIGPILQNQQVMGYFLFYQTDKIGRGEYSYQVEMLDQNLNVVNSNAIEGSKKLMLLDCKYNNETLMLAFYDSKKKQFIYKQFDTNANQVSENTNKLGKMQAMAIDMMIKNSPENFSNVLPVNNAGFASYSTTVSRNSGYKIEFFPSNKDFKEWEYSSSKKSKKFEGAAYLYADETVLLNTVFKSNSYMRKEVEYFLLALDPANGKKLFEIEVEDDNYALMILSGYRDENEDNFYILGNYYDKGANQISESSKGIFLKKLDLKGNIINEKYISWEKDVSALLTEAQKENIENLSDVFFHNIFKNADGKTYLISEQFDKKSGRKIYVNDFMIFELDNTFNLNKVSIVSKEQTELNFPSIQADAYLLATYLKVFGGFDFEFFQTNSDKSIFSIGYVDYVEMKGEPNKYKFGSITYTDSEATNDEMILMTAKEKKAIKVMPAMAGNIVVVEYNKDEKSLDLRLEKINY
jgi:hypothetical protein